MAILRHTEDGKYVFFCPACRCGHYFNNTWTWNGDWEKPTVSPSILVRSIRDITDDEHAKIMAGEKLDIPKTICHSFVKEGKIEFLSDCTHELAGKTVNLENF